MKKHLSVLMIASRTIWRVVAVILATAAVQTAIFAAIPAEWTETYEYTTQDGVVTDEYTYPLSLEETFDKAHTGLVAAVGFVLLCFILCVKTSGFGSHVQYTVSRLGVREEALNLWWAAYHTACVILFWMSQILVTYLLCRLYLHRASPDLLSGQTITLAYYRQTYLYNLMPGADVGCWLRNGLLAPMLGAAMSHFAMVQRRRGRISFLTLVSVAMTVALFMLPINNDMSRASVLPILIMLGALLVGLLYTARTEEAEEEEVWG